MAQTDGAEEFDPETGTFRPIATRRPAPADPSPRRPMGSVKPAMATGLSEHGQKYGVFFEIFEHAAMSRGGTIMYRGAQVVIAVIFVLLIYEAVTYRMALGG